MADSIVFLDSAQEKFGSYVRDVFVKEQGLDPSKLRTVSITSSNEDCAEAAETGSVDFALNGRELYRIFLRTGGAPHRKDGSTPDSFGKPEETLLPHSYDFLNREIVLTDLDISGGKHSAAIANDLGQTRELLELFKTGKAPAEILWLRA